MVKIPLVLVKNTTRIYDFTALFYNKFFEKDVVWKAFRR